MNGAEAKGQRFKGESIIELSISIAVGAIGSGGINGTHLNHPCVLKYGKL